MIYETIMLIIFRYNENILKYYEPIELLISDIFNK